MEYLDTTVIATALPQSVPFSVADFHWASAAASALALCSVIGYARLPRDAGSAIGGGAG